MKTERLVSTFLCLAISVILSSCGGSSGSGNTGGGGTGGGGTTTPTPTVTSISPTSTTAGSGPLTLTVNGTNFLSSTTVEVGGADDATTYVSATQVTATVEPAQIASGGIFSVIALNGPSTSGSGTPVNLAVNNPAPAITATTPSAEFVGTATPTVAVIGTGFVPTTVIDVNGAARTTTYVSATQTDVLLNSSDVAAGGSLSLTAVNGTPGGGTSTAAMLPVNNPVPEVTKIAPALVITGTSTPTTITVTGLNFVPTSTVELSGTAVTTTYVSSTQLTFPLSAANQTTTAQFVVQVVNGTPGGGTSIGESTLDVVPQSPQPVITEVEPSQFVVGSGPTTIVIYGSNIFPEIFEGSGLVSFPIPTSVTWNGTALPVEGFSFSGISTNETLTAEVPASLLASIGNASIIVTNPASVPAASSPVTVSIANPPAPTLTSISPSGGPINTATPITLNGTGFTQSSTVALNGTNLPATFENSSELTATIPASAIATPGNVNLTVSTPAPGGGTTTPMGFTADIAMTNNDIVYRATDGLLYVSVPGSAPSYGNSVVAIDPVTGNVVSQIQVGSNPDKLALSTDGTQLFVGLDGAGAVAQVSLASGQVVNQFSLGSGSNYYNEPITAQYIAPVPGLPNSVAVSSSADVVTIYDSGVARTGISTTFGYNYYGALSFGASATTLFVANYSGEVMQMTVGSTGITAGSVLFTSTSELQISALQYDIGKLYLSNGEVVNATNGTLAGTFYAAPTSPASGPIVSDSVLGLAFVAFGSDITPGSEVLAFNESTFNGAGNIPINGPITLSYPYGFERIVRWGQNGVALNTSSQIFIFQSPVVKSLSASPADLSVALSAPATATTGTAISSVATVQNAGPSAAQGATLSLSLDPSFIVNSITPSQGSCGTGNAFNCDLGSLANGSSATVTVSATPTTAGSFSGSAAVTSVSYDPTTTNNQATASTTVTGSFYAMPPVLSSISPALVQAGSGAFTLTVNGAGFNENSTVNVGGSAMATSYVNATQLTANVTGAAIAKYGWAPVTVTNASPGGGTSQLSPLTIYDLVNVTPNNILFDPFAQQIYATVPSTSTTVSGDSIVAINPLTGAVGTPVLVGSQPTVMTETSDGNILYIGLTGSDSLAEYNLMSQSLVATIPIAYTQSGNSYSEYATYLSAMPGADSTLAMTFAGTYSNFGIFDVTGSTGAFRPNLSGYYGGGLDPVFASATEIYAAANDEFYRFSVNSTGVTNIDSTELAGLGGYQAGFDLAGGLVYGGEGGVVNPTTTPPTQIALQFLPEFYQEGITESGVGAIADPSTQKDFVMEENLAGTEDYALARFNTTTYLAESVVVLPVPVSDIETTWTMLRWGQAGMALLSVPNAEISPQAPAQLLLIEGPLVTPQLLQADTGATLTSNSAPTLTHGAGNTVLTLTGSNFLPGVAVSWNGSYRTTTLVSSTQVTVDIPASDLANAGSATLVATNPGAAAAGELTITIN
jgi:trimeric autotransporter adhesin